MSNEEVGSDAEASRPIRTDERPGRLRLSELEPHHFGIVRNVEAAADELNRLMAMGVCAGRIVELVRKGDPLILKVFGSRVGVSARLARQVWVDACDIEGCPLLKLAPGAEDGS